jgi:hypothetical protein
VWIIAITGGQLSTKLPTHPGFDKQTLLLVDVLFLSDDQTIVTICHTCHFGIPGIDKRDSSGAVEQTMAKLSVLERLSRK